MMLTDTLLSEDSDWLCDTLSRVLNADWLISEKNEKANLHIIMPYRSVYHIH